MKRFLRLSLQPLGFAAALLLCSPAVAQTAPVLMLSDIHLDPFHEPSKVAQLRVAPVAGWAAILNAPAAAGDNADFAHLQSVCGARGVDTPAVLLEASLKAERVQQPKPLFVTVSGDLMAHQFDCRFKTLVPAGTDAEYSAFAAKTVAYVALRLRETFPGTPVYLALGNNDSGCKDYDEDPNSAYLQADGLSFAADAVSPANRAAIQREFSQLGDYNVALPLAHTRLIVMQDIFESKKYVACNGEALAGNMPPSEMQTAWLRTQLEKARAADEHVWVMAHIPPGIDAYSTFSKGRKVCAGDKPEMFLSSEALAKVITDFPETIRLALFGHTHMDELRVYKSADGAVIPGKLVPSITPINGNSPAFTVAEVNTRTATLKDYAVFVASNKTGVDAKWTEEYRYSTTYKLPDLSGESLAKLTESFLADKTSASAVSKAYQAHYFAGDPMANTGISGNLKAAAMQVVWPGYACSMTEATQSGFKTCACPAQASPEPAE